MKPTIIKARRQLALCLLLIIYISNVSYGQDTTDTQDRYTPYELLSSYYNEDFKPFKKNNKYLGLAFAISDRKQENDQGLLVNYINGDHLRYDLSFKGGYYFADYVMGGINVDFFEQKFTGLIQKDADSIQSNSITRGYMLTPNLRVVLPLTPNDRLSFFVEIGVGYGTSNTLVRDTKNIDEVTKTYSTEYNFFAGVSPGITFFAMENFAFEVQLNAFGYELQVTDTNVDDNVLSRDTRQNVNFRIDLLTLDLGLAYNFGSGVGNRSKK